MDPSEEAFKTLPIIDPRTGDDIKINSKEYKQLVKLYGEPYPIQSPSNGKMIPVGKVAYNNLIKQGYTDKEILTPVSVHIIDGIKYTEQEMRDMIQFYKQNFTKSIVNTNTNINENMTEDVLNHIFLQMDVNSLYKMCSLNKKYKSICVSTTFWRNKFMNDGIPFFEIKEGSLKKWIQHYQKWKDA